VAVTYTTAVKNAKLDALTTACGSSPLLRIYDGTPPASANAALSGNTKLAELTMSATPFPAASGGVLTANAITTDSSADATGTASFFRIYKSDGTTVIAQGTVGTSGADLNLTSTSIVAATAVAVSSLVITSAN
jgi:hypothetical protein